MPADSSEVAPRVSEDDGGLAVALLVVATIGIVASVLAIRGGEPLEAHVWPITAAMVTGVLSGSQLLRQVVQRRSKHKSSSASASDAATPTADVGPPWRLMALVASTICYVYLLEVVGFVLATVGFYLAAQKLVSPQTAWWRLSRSTIVFSVVLVALFLLVIGVAVPYGQEPFAEVQNVIGRIRYEYL